MKQLIYIIILLLQGVSLYAYADRAAFNSIVYFPSSEEITALWEKDSESGLLGDSVLSGFRTKQEHSFKLNALCSTESIEKLISLRELTVKVISSSVSNGRWNRSTALAVEILAKLNGVSVIPLTAYEMELAATAEKINQIDDNLSDGCVSSGAIPIREYSASLTGITRPLPSPAKLKLCTDRQLEIFYTLKSIQCRKNLYYNEFADLYRLFFYIKDNSGNAESGCLRHNGRSFSLLQTLNNSTRFKITSKTETEFLESGASL